MSNIKMPTMTYDNLDTILGKSEEKTICYATKITRWANGAIAVRQHGNTIAVLSPLALFVTNCGWDSSTTANRLRKIMGDNKIGYYVRIRDFGMRLFNSAHTEIDSAFHSALFTKHEGFWMADYESLS